MNVKKSMILVTTVQLAFIFFHLHHKSTVLQLMHKQQELATEKQRLILAASERQLTYEQLKNPTTLLKQAQSTHMQKVRLNTIKHLPKGA